MYYVQWRIGLISTFFFLVFGACYIYVYYTLSNISYYRFRLEATLMNEFEDVLKNNENIILNNTVEFEKDRLEKLEKAYQKSFRQEMISLNGVKIVFIVLLLLYMFFIIFYCATMTMEDRVPAAKLVMLTTAVVLMVRSISNLIRRCTDSIMEVGPLLKDNVFGNLVEETHIHKGREKDFMKEYRIDVRNVKFIINKKTILQDVSLSIPFRTSVLITGEIGTGKSTLLKLISGYFYASSGDVFFDGVSIRKIDIEYLRLNITMMHQHITMFKRPVLENIFYGMEQKEELMDQLKTLTVYPHVKSFLYAPDATKLSGGQRQIVLLLRCLFRSPKILILDEPTANMDTGTKSVIMNILDMLKTRMTLLAVSHDSSIFSRFDVKYIMKNGCLFQAS
jgi:ABC-type bacteriocin/lantibiotic exporter with double-glycine peptidase domain